MSRTRIGAILESANTADILFFINEHPGCYKSEIYQNVTRNAHTREKNDRLCEEGLISMTPTGKANSTLMNLTPKGSQGRRAAHRDRSDTRFRCLLRLQNLVSLSHSGSSDGPGSELISARFHPEFFFFTVILP